jgi:hypothetical protein
MKTHFCKIVFRQLLLICLGVAAWSQFSAPLTAQTKPSKTPALEIKLDTAQAPEIAKWAAEAKTRCEKFYPTIVKQLGGPYARQPLSVTIAFEKGHGIAATAGTHIACNADWFTQHPDDYGAVIHELCHVVQAYGNHQIPGWVVEGIADYVRWFKYESPQRRPRPNPDTANYTDGYQTTAAFFDWIVRTKDKTFVQRLNSAARSGKYSDELFRQYARKPLDELWTEYIDSLKP